MAKINIIRVIQRTGFWVVLSYIVPIISIIISLLVIKKSNFSYFNAASIIISTNACFIVSIMSNLYNQNKRREGTFISSIVILVICMAFYSITIIQTELKITVFSNKAYLVVSILTLVCSLILTYICKQDEVQEEIEEFANSSKNKNETIVNGKNLKI